MHCEQTECANRHLIQTAVSQIPFNPATHLDDISIIEKSIPIIVAQVTVLVHTSPSLMWFQVGVKLT